MKNKLNRFLQNPLFKNILGIGVFRILGIATNFYLIGLVYRYFSNQEMNGIWLTISSLLTWLAFFDFGMGNSLRNKLTESITKKDTKLANMYISTTYILMLIPTILIIVFSMFASSKINWINFFNIQSTELTNKYLSTFIIVLIVIYALNFYLSIIFAILHAIFKSYLISVTQLIVNIINITLITILYFIGVDSLFLLGTVYVSSSLFVLIVLTFILFKFNKYNLCFRVKYYNRKLIKEITSTGLKFLFLQLAIIILFNTDNFLISKFLTVELVTPYQLLYKLLSIFTLGLGIILTPIWTQIINEYTQKEKSKINMIIQKLMWLYCLLLLGVLIMGFISPYVIKIWTGTMIEFDRELIFCMIIFTGMHMWCNIFQTILNGINKLNVQLLCYSFGMLINIPISIYLVENTMLGSAAIILGTVISLILPTIILPIYTWRIFK